ncbi:MAG: hypothetical protein KC474_05935 [Cyanobacteria bacterium HKST-UBA04]|nr:hypothetical protein [Cyanobacteria bacterium HKST-UBA04]MCA9841436.1 hypothetical protein [Cyanobacteria bacterium HKST-UBA03]
MDQSRQSPDNNQATFVSPTPPKAPGPQLQNTGAPPPNTSPTASPNLSPNPLPTAIPPAPAGTGFGASTGASTGAGTGHMVFNPPPQAPRPTAGGPNKPAGATKPPPLQDKLTEGNRATDGLLVQQWLPIVVPFGLFILDAFLGQHGTLNLSPYASQNLQVKSDTQRLIVTFNADRLNWLAIDIEQHLEQQGIGVLNDHDPPHEERRLIEHFLNRTLHTLVVSSRKLNTLACQTLLNQPHCADHVILDSLYWSTVLPNWHIRFGSGWLKDLAARPAIATANRASITMPLISRTGLGDLSKSLSIHADRLGQIQQDSPVIPINILWRWNEQNKWRFVANLVETAPAGSTLVLAYQPGGQIDTLLGLLQSANIRYCHFVQRSTAADFEQLNQFLGNPTQTTVVVLPYDAIPNMPLPFLVLGRPGPWHWVCWHPPWTMDLLMNISLDGRFPAESSLTILDCHQDWRMLKQQSSHNWQWNNNVNPFKESLENLQALVLQKPDCLIKAWCTYEQVGHARQNACVQCPGCRISPYSSSKWMKKVLQRLF